MKTASNRMNQNTNVYRHYRRRYPNAADPQYFVDKLVDGMLAIVTGMGALTVFLLLITM